MDMTGTASKYAIATSSSSTVTAIFCFELQAGLLLPDTWLICVHPLCGQPLHDADCGSEARLDGAMPLSDQQSGGLPSSPGW
jgi:hypothetical protein